MSNLDDKDFQNYLEQNDWTIECESPLEIRHKDGSFASQYAAKVLVAELYKEYQESSVSNDEDENVQFKDFEKLENLYNIMDSYIQAAQQVESDNPPTEFDESRLSSAAYDVWKKTYNLVFSDEISKKIRFYVDKLGGEINYYSNYGYNDDVMAFYNTVKSEMESLTKIFRPTNSNKMRM